MGRSLLSYISDIFALSDEEAMVRVQENNDSKAIPGGIRRSSGFAGGSWVMDIAARMWRRRCLCGSTPGGGSFGATVRFRVIFGGWR